MNKEDEDDGAASIFLFIFFSIFFAQFSFIIYHCSKKVGAPPIHRVAGEPSMFSFGGSTTFSSLSGAVVSFCSMFLAALSFHSFGY